MRKKITHEKSGNAGFSLLEVMMAMAILTIGILAIVGIQHHIVNGNTNANVVTQEMNLAQRFMEQYKNLPSPSKRDNLTLNNIDAKGQAGGPYNVTVTITNPLGGSVSRFITVNVTRTGGVGGHPVIIRSLTLGNGT